MKLPSLYIHIPFCSRKCLFCSFAIVVGQDHRREEYVNTLINEMEKYERQGIGTIYFGGGTPSMLDENHFNVLMDAIRKKFSFQNDIEITLEANPESIDRAKANFLKKLGINRISLGVQSLDDRYLKFLGRAHDARMAQDAYHILREAGFSNINLDLMYAFPGETKEELEKDVRGISALGSEHLSLYTLTVDKNSRFFADHLKLDDDEKLAEQYLMIAGILKEYGFRQYEISNFSKPGFESMHNKNYWLGTPYLALGLGAHGFDGRRRSWNVPRLQDYLERVTKSGDAIDGYEDLTDDQLTMEKVLFGLRMNEGIALDRIPLNRMELIQLWIKDGFLLLDEKNLKVTNRGRLILDELSARLI